MSLAGHCSGLFQTIRDEGADEEGRGALNFLGGIVQVIDDPTNDELEVHIGKQPDLTDLFATSNSAPHLTLGATGKVIGILSTIRAMTDGTAIIQDAAGNARLLVDDVNPHFRADGTVVTDNLGVNIIPTVAAVRAVINGLPADSTTSPMSILRVNFQATQIANRATGIRRGFDFDPTYPYDQGAFTLARFVGGSMVAPHQMGDGLGGVASLTRYVGMEFGVSSGVASGGVETLTRANAVEILPPVLVGPFAAIPNLAGIFVGNQGSAEVTGTSYAIEVEPQSGSPTNVGLALRASAVYPAPSTQAITAATQAITPTRRTHRISANASYTLTSAPTIANGVDGQRVLIINVDTGADVVTIQDQGTLAGSNLRLGAATRALGPRDSIELQYDSAIGDWVELAYSNVI